MERIEKTVFISYRRTNAAWTLAIYQYLTYRGYDVFYDISGLGAGDFEPIILENIRTRAHFLALLTPSALERCKEPGDWLRREIELALDCGRNVIPVLLDRFQFGLPGIADQLTGKLARLRTKNALPVHAEYFDAAMERLMKFLNVAVAAAPHPASPAGQEGAREQQAQASAAPPVTQDELTAEEWFERAFQSEDLEEQIRFYTRAIERNPVFVEALNNCGIARKNKGDFEGAIRDYDEAIRLKPDYAAAFNNRGIARKNKGDFEGAIRDYDEAIRLNPDDAEAFFNRGIARRNKGDFEGAIRDFDEAIRLKPDYAEAFNNRGVARKNKGDFEGAEQDFAEARRLGLKES